MIGLLQSTTVAEGTILAVGLVIFCDTTTVLVFVQLFEGFVTVREYVPGVEMTTVEFVEMVVGVEFSQL